MAGSRRVWVVLFALLALIAAGCARKAVAPAKWNAAVQVEGNRATVTVDFPGKQMGKDYHPHLFLDGGSEVMMFTPTYTFNNLTPGSHKVRVTVSDPAHQDMKDMVKMLEFVVS